jgi:hypothetical protein
MPKNAKNARGKAHVRSKDAVVKRTIKRFVVALESALIEKLGVADNRGLDRVMPMTANQVRSFMVFLANDEIDTLRVSKDSHQLARRGREIIEACDKVAGGLQESNNEVAQQVGRALKDNLKECKDLIVAVCISCVGREVPVVEADERLDTLKLWGAACFSCYIEKEYHWLE